MALFMDWARRAGHRGGHLVVDGSDLERVLTADGVVALALDAGAAHSHCLDVTALAGSLV